MAWMLDKILYPMFLTKLALSNLDLIYQESFDDGEHDWNFTTNSNTAYPTISNCDDNSANNCLYLRDKSTAWIEISTVNYTGITVLYDIYISNNWENCTVDDCLMDQGVIGYSCGNNVIHGMDYYTANTINDIVLVNVSYHLRNECSDISNMKLYVISILIRNYNKYLSIGNIRIYGEHKEYQSKSILPTPLFSDDFTDGSENWDDLDMFVYYNWQYCIDKPCVRLAFQGDIRIANGISTIGYQNIRLNYDIAIDRNYDGNINDTFRVYYSCDGSEINIKTYSGNIFPVFILGEEVLLPSVCDNVDNLTVRFQSESQMGNAYIDNVNIYGSIIEKNPTSTPTIEPTNIPTISPSTAPTMTPTVYPSTTPTRSPTSVPTKIPTNSILASSTLNPTSFQAPLQTDALQRAPRTTLHTHVIIYFIIVGVCVLTSCVCCILILCYILFKKKTTTAPNPTHPKVSRIVSNSLQCNDRAIASEIQKHEQDISGILQDITQIGNDAALARQVQTNETNEPNDTDYDMSGIIIVEGSPDPYIPNH